MTTNKRDALNTHTLKSSGVKCVVFIVDVNVQDDINLVDQFNVSRITTGYIKQAVEILSSLNVFFLKESISFDHCHSFQVLSWFFNRAISQTQLFVGSEVGMFLSEFSVTITANEI